LGILNILSIFLLLLLFTTSSISQQTRSELESARLAVIKQIEDTENEIIWIKRKKSALISEINAVELRIDNYDSTLSTLPKETVLESEPPMIDTTLILAISDEKGQLITAYNNLLRSQYRSKLLTQNGRLLAHQEVSAHLVKWRMFKNLEQQLISKINATPSSTPVKEKQEPSSEAPELVAPSSLVSLKSKEAKLMQEATELTYSEQRLTKKLDRLEIEWERYNQAIESSLLNGQNNNSSTIPATSHSDLASIPIISASGIEGKRGFLPWPLENAVVVKRHGPGYGNTAGTTMRYGIDVSAGTTQATAVYEGTILSIKTNSDQSLTVLVQHDNDYVSSYAQLNTVSVSQGSFISQGNVIGQVKTNNSGQGLMHFEFHKGKKPLNPMHWLKNN